MPVEFAYSSDDFKEASVNEYQAEAGPSKKIEKGLKRLLIIAGLILGGEFIWLFVVSPCMPLSTVEVKGFPGFDGRDALNYAGVGEGASFVSVNAAQTQKILAEHYLVESAKVIKRFPDRLSVFLEPRRAVAMSLAETGGRLLPVYYDRYGVVLRIGGEKGKAENLPLVSGLVFEHPAAGMRLPDFFTPFLAEIAKIESDCPELLEALSEIRIVRKPYNGFDLVLYPVHHPVRVRLGNTINEETLRYVLLMLDVAGSWKPVPDEIDFRLGIGSYKVKEAHFDE